MFFIKIECMIVGNKNNKLTYYKNKEKAELDILSRHDKQKKTMFTKFKNIIIKMAQKREEIDLCENLITQYDKYLNILEVDVDYKKNLTIEFNNIYEILGINFELGEKNIFDIVEDDSLILEESYSEESGIMSVSSEGITQPIFTQSEISSGLLNQCKKLSEETNIQNKLNNNIDNNESSDKSNIFLLLNEKLNNIINIYKEEEILKKEVVSQLLAIKEEIEEIEKISEKESLTPNQENKSSDKSIKSIFKTIKLKSSDRDVFNSANFEKSKTSPKFQFRKYSSKSLQSMTAPNSIQVENLSNEFDKSSDMSDKLYCFYNTLFKYDEINKFHIKTSSLNFSNQNSYRNLRHSSSQPLPEYVCRSSDLNRSCSMSSSYSYIIKR